LLEHSNGDARQLAEQTWAVTKILNKLGLFTTEVFQQSRDAIIKRQSQELAFHAGRAVVG
jgi:rsbT co-antagonist protein RsbR